jgi:glycosyltransferase involved in cell wall biosynthesis
MTVPSLAKEFGGPIGKAHALAAALRALGHDVALAGAGSAGDPRTLGLGEIGSFHATPLPRRLTPLGHLVAGADVVHVLGFRDPVGTFAAREAIRRSIPFVLEPAGMLRGRVRSLRLKRAFDRTLGMGIIEGAAAIVVTSSVEADDLSPILPAGAAVTIRPNGVDISELLPLPSRGPLRRRFLIPDEARLIVTLARIGAIKGLPGIAAALGDLPGVWWLLGGPDAEDGTLYEILGQLDRSKATDRAVIVRGGLWGDDKLAALAEADVFCLPSDYESFGSAAVEAAAVGIRVVISDGCGAKDVLTGPSVEVAPRRSHLQLREALRRALAKGPPNEPGISDDELSWAQLAVRQVGIYEAALGR